MIFEITRVKGSQRGQRPRRFFEFLPASKLACVIMLDNSYCQ